MMIPKLSVTTETNKLEAVIIGYADNFDLQRAEIINETQKKYYFGPNRPQIETLVNQLDGLTACLEERGVTVYRPRPIAGVPDQMMARDIGIVIKDKFVLTRMAARSRQNEWRGLAPLLAQFGEENVIRVPEGIILEGGDVIVDKGYIFVGIGQRSTLAGARFLARRFPEYEVIPLYLKSVAEGEDVLHLDCAFVPVGEKHGLIYKQGFKKIPAQLLDTYRLIEVTQEEQRTLGTNVLSISPTQVISRQRAMRINRQMRKAGLEVFALPFSEPTKTGGSFRCCSLPLLRREAIGDWLASSVTPLRHTGRN